VTTAYNPRYEWAREDAEAEAMAGNGDKEDVEEGGYWRCPICGAGGWCVKGDEAMAVAVHIMAVHPTPKKK
jgi:rubrerythrin